MKARKRQTAVSSRRKIKTFAQIAAIRRQLRSQDLRVVMTNGVFDVLHSGHVTYLEKARSFGDVLIVGLNADKSVRELKGPLRPLVPQRERVLLLGALWCVDYVVIFNEKRATRLIAAVKPDVYVKGGDYRIKTLDKDEINTVKSGGGVIKLVPMVPGKSTTDIIQTILARFSAPLH